MFKYLTLPILLSSISFSCTASSPQAWEDFRTAVKEKCEVEIQKNFEIDSMIIDPEGSDSYGIAIATGVTKTDNRSVSQVCIFDKKSEQVELGTRIVPLVRGDSIDIHQGENPQLDRCMNKAITKVEMGACQEKYGVKG